MKLNGLNIEVVAVNKKPGWRWTDGGLHPEQWEIRGELGNVLGIITDRRLAEALGVKPLVKEPA